MPTLRARNNNLPPRRHKPNKEIYQSSRWHRESKAFLKLPHNRLCRHCLNEGKTTLSRCTDHIIPISEGGSIWDRSNWQGLCLTHHSQKTSKENKNWNIRD